MPQDYSPFPHLFIRQHTLTPLFKGIFYPGGFSLCFQKSLYSLIYINKEAFIFSFLSSSSQLMLYTPYFKGYSLKN